jgi:hypothetical protein
MFGKGKIDITLQRTNYVPGDTTSGTVTLTLEKPVEAREMNMSLIGEGKTAVTTPGIVGGRGFSLWRMGPGGTTSTTVTCPVRICDSKQQLDNEKEYSQGQQYYSFDMKIPTDILSIGPQITGRSKWHLLAKLDVPHGLDLSKKVKVTIG